MAPAPLFRRSRGASSIEDERAMLRQAREAAALQLEAMKRELADRVQAIRDRERQLEEALARTVPPPTPALPKDDQRLTDLGPPEPAVVEQVRLPAPPAPSTAERERVEQRLAELREAEKLFLRTQAELAARSEAIAARERLVASRERDQGDGDGREHAEPADLETRPRRLERTGGTQTGDDTASFAAGLESLRRRGTRRPA